jgi:hypothetical protein
MRSRRRDRIRLTRHAHGWTFTFFDHVRQEQRTVEIYERSHRAAWEAFRTLLRQEREEKA